VRYALTCLVLIGAGAGLTGSALFGLAEGVVLPVGVLLWTAFWSAAAGAAAGLVMMRAERMQCSLGKGRFAPRRFELRVEQPFAEHARALLNGDGARTLI
jgi:hypothetical protein